MALTCSQSMNNFYASLVYTSEVLHNPQEKGAILCPAKFRCQQVIATLKNQPARISICPFPVITLELFHPNAGRKRAYCAYLPLSVKNVNAGWGPGAALTLVGCGMNQVKKLHLCAE